MTVESHVPPGPLADTPVGENARCCVLEEQTNGTPRDKQGRERFSALLSLSVPSRGGWGPQQELLQVVPAINPFGDPTGPALGQQAALRFFHKNYHQTEPANVVQPCRQTAGQWLWLSCGGPPVRPGGRAAASWDGLSGEPSRETPPDDRLCCLKAVSRDDLR